MKQTVLTLFLALALLPTMTACSAAGAARTLDRAEDKIEHKLDAAEDKVEDVVRKAVTPAPAATSTFPAAVPTEPAPTVPATAPTEAAPIATAPAPAQAITKEDAQKIALDHLGLTADQVTRLHTSYEIDDRIPQYDVEFLEGDWEYEFEIHAETGKILSFDKDHKYD